MFGAFSITLMNGLDGRFLKINGTPSFALATIISIMEPNYNKDSTEVAFGAGGGQHF
jgi:hypothetical protein